MIDNLTIVPAGAGAGKTYRIEKQLAQWVEDEVVAPGRILAVTFTEAAANELKTRIRAELMKRGRIDDALEIDRAYVGTIHALGHRLLTEHAFAAGRSPESRLLSEAERDMLIRLEIHKCAALQPVMQDLARFGYSWNPLTDMTAEEAFRSDLLRTVDLLRGLGVRGLTAAVLESALAALEAGYGPREASGSALTDALARAAQALLTDFPESLASGAANDAARKAFAKDHTNLRKAAQSDALARDWKLWQALRDLRMSKRGSPTPAGYDEAAQAVMDAAEGLLIHPGPLADARTHISALVHGAQELLASYEAAKRRGGLIDYADMITETEDLLRTRPDILAAVLAEIDCVVIDEFQDTNPVQFALLWRLARGAGRAMIVGDTKQSIMGFQGADARLANALQSIYSDRVDPLDRNWRSDPRIMSFVNTLGPALFPEGYDPLAAIREPTGVTALETILLPRSWADRKNHAADCVADRVAGLLADGEQVFDKQTECLRPARTSDIAVLCYTSAKCVAMADALRSRGLPVRIQADGWLTAPATRAARAALAYVADPDDEHAALRYLTLGPAQLFLEDALKSAVDGTLNTHLSLEPLRTLHIGAYEMPVAALVAEMFALTELRDWATKLAEPAQALADLARIEAEAQAFDVKGIDLRAAAGFHGSGPQVFLGWIAAQTEKDWNRQPDASGWSAPGVEISTWHGAKGREWPITFVAGLDFRLPERPGSLRAEFDRFDDLENVLDHAGLGWLPDFAAPEKQKVFADALIAADERDAARELYVALTRARDRLILVLPPEPSREKDRAERLVDLLRARASLEVTADGDGMTLCGQSFPARVTLEPGDRDFPQAKAPAPCSLPRFGRPESLLPLPRTQWRQSPSTPISEIRNGHLPLTNIELGPKVGGSHDAFALATERGSAWHLAFRVLCDRQDLRDRLPVAAELDTHTIDAIAAQVQGVRDWLQAQGYNRLHFELPIQSVADDGSEVNAIIDCLAEGPEGFLILDHKSGPCPDPQTRFMSYVPQLRAYAQIVGARWTGKPVKQVAINWMNEGVISVTPVAAL